MSEPFGFSAIDVIIRFPDGDYVPTQFAAVKTERFEFMQFTGLADKNGKFVFEYDLINNNGEVIGNYYEDKTLYSTGTYCVVTELCAKTWTRTEAEITKRGCGYA